MTDNRHQTPDDRLQPRGEREIMNCELNHRNDNTTMDDEILNQVQNDKGRERTNTNFTKRGE
jgi:hypothetical protein